MTLEFPYLPVALSGLPPPSLSSIATVQWRPFVPVRIGKPAGAARDVGRALLDTGADDTVFPLALAASLGIDLLPDEGYGIRWQGRFHPLRFGMTELRLETTAAAVTWTAVVGFTSAAMRYPLLGHAGCLEFFDATFVGESKVVRLKTNRLFPGMSL